MKIFDSKFTGLEKALDVHFRRHGVLTGNLANSETPHYQARELDFAGTLEKAFGNGTSPLVTTDSKHMDLGGNSGDMIVFDNAGAMGADGNNVDLDVTMGKISANARAYESAVGLMSQKFRLLKGFVRRGA